MEFVRAMVDLVSVAAPILLLALRIAAIVAVFPEFRDFCASLGSS